MERNENVQNLSDWVMRSMKKSGKGDKMDFNIVSYSGYQLDEAIERLSNEGYNAILTNGKGNPDSKGNNLAVTKE